MGLSYVPNRYTSEATLLIVQQQVPERYVVPTTTTDINNVLGAMSGEVLSRTRLLAVIDDLHLYPRQRAQIAPETLVELMRRDIMMAPVQTTPGRRVDAFKISFTSDSPDVAQAVTSNLTNLFIEENLKTRADQATTTTGFLHEQVESARQKLADQEQRLRDFKMQYLGELPEQQQGNLNILGGLHSQLDNVMAGLNRARQQQLYLESLLNEYRRLNRRTGAVAGSSGESMLQIAERDLARMRSEREQLRSRYTDRYPDVLKKEEDIRRQEALVGKQKQAEAQMAANPQAASSSSTAAPDPETNTAVAQLSSQLNANRLEIENLSQSETKITAGIEGYEARLNLTPVREQQLTAMLRDYDLLKQNYTDLLNKELQSQLASNLEKRQEGQQFRLVDPPNLPMIPSSPKRVKITLGGLAAGLVFGFALAFFVDMRDRSVHSEEQLRQQLGFPMTIGIPFVRTPAEQRGASRKRALEWVAASVLLFTICLVGIQTLRHG